MALCIFPYRGYTRSPDGNYHRTATFDGESVTIVRSPSGRILETYTDPADLTRAAQIIRLVCDRYNVTTSDLEGPARPWRIVWPRFLAIYLIRRFTHLTQIQIGHLFDRNHGTVSTALQALENEVQTNRSASRQLAELEAALKNLQPAT